MKTFGRDILIQKKLLLFLLFLIIISVQCISPIKGYTPKQGDIIFQSLWKNDLTEAIEGITESPYSHCGVVFKKKSGWYVIEAIGPVKETRIRNFLWQGVKKQIDIYRLDEKYLDSIPAFISALKSYLGRPYDIKYKMDDQKIYCSELIYKAFKEVYNENLGVIKKLGDLNWTPYTATIKHYEEGPVPIEREIISPRAVSEAKQLKLIYKGIKDE